jgi:4,5-dihydroxyphthalate decarboxylase
MTDGPVTLRVAIGDYPHTLPLKRGEITSPLLKLDFVEVKPMHLAAKPMVREHAYDIGEVALVTVLQAKVYNKGLRLLPAAMLSRFQHHTCLYNSARGVLRPADLAGKRIGIRSYSQTTGAYIRGILENDYGVDLSGVQWVTFEDGHVAEAKDPDGVIRATAGKDMTQMLIDGELDAAIYGAAMPDNPRLTSVIPDPHAAALAWYGKHDVVPVNHMVVTTDELMQSQPQAVAEFYRLLEEGKKAAGLPKAGEIDTVKFGREENRPCLEMLIKYADQQKLIPGRLSVDELW